MNILASYNWMKEYLDRPLSPEELAKRLTASGMSVEYRHDLARRYAPMVVGVIREVLPHPKADRLRIVKTDVGDHTATIVCGGVNLEVGHRVAVALPGASVRWHGEGEPVVLERTAIRGVESEGMICAVEEIGLEKLMLKSEGPMIWDISEITDAAAGTSLATALGLEDMIFDIEVTTNRPDAMSIIGLAREAGAVEAGRFHFTPATLPFSSEETHLDVEVKDAHLCPRYQAIVMDGVQVGPSPWWLQARLLLAGHRPINNVVDITNYILHEYGQPMHAFDYDKLAEGRIVVRRAEDGEMILALDGKSYVLSHDNLVIADARRPVAVAGVMGGEATGTTERTTRIVLECATFEPVSVRLTSRALNLSSDSQQLFEKGLSTEATAAALARAIELVTEIAGGRVASSVADVREDPYVPLVFPYDPADVNARLGLEIPAREQQRILESLGFMLEPSGSAWLAHVPFWRDHDIEGSVDFTEEVARVFGYHNLPSVLPSSSVPPHSQDMRLVRQDRLKQSLAAASATELFHYSFASTEDIADWPDTSRMPLAFQNPLSEDQKFLRLSLVPSVLRSIERNQGLRASELVFELANVYWPREGDLPLEAPHLVIAGYGKPSNDFRFVKGVLERVLSEHIAAELLFLRGESDGRWHPGRCARILLGGNYIGTIGELLSNVQKRFDINERVVLAEINLDSVLSATGKGKRFVPVPEFPSVTRDLALVLDRDVSYADVAASLSNAHPLLVALEPFDVYEGKGVEEGKKSLALHLTFQSAERTLTSEEVDEVLSTLREALERGFSAIMRS